jgi:hypothetical protein
MIVVGVDAYIDPNLPQFVLRADVGISPYSKKLHL